ncbi:DEBR0S5_06524g1_1 [Brettanomyces bruxellensis]|uniref:DEBR0S5_06524g1_1 n=2 Tax=Dekkera bruxellensis TaxID=5007 RepID=A0A3F2Y6D3_DEKBR|nr:DEBR0S5_06524g1_1 [Brettanomyces bruxellensis]
MTTIHEQGMLDIGKHCCICRRLDFLPYTCPKCSMSFCNEHRKQFNEHKCIVQMRKKRTDGDNKNIDTSKLPPASSLFPDVEKMRRDANEKAKHQHKKGAYLFGRRLGTSKDEKNTKSQSTKPITGVESALFRLKTFMGKYGGTHNSSSGRLHGKSKLLGLYSGFSGKQSSTQRLVSLARLKKAAKGDNRVSSSQRIYVHCIYIDPNASEKHDQVPLFCSKAWPVGRMLDSFSDLMSIKNVNNMSTDESQKLTVFRARRYGEKTAKDAASLADKDFVYIPSNGRVNKEIQDLDTVYIVRGAENMKK